MSAPMPEPDQPFAVRARLTYTVDTGEKPVSATAGPGGRLRHRTGKFEQHETEIRNAWPLRPTLDLDVNGFAMVEHRTQMADFHDEQALRAVYYPEMESLVTSLTGARRVLIFDHTLRSGDEADRAARFLREPVRVVHNDYTEWSGPQRVRDVLPDEAEQLLTRRFAIVQVWRAIRRSIARDPLALCDARSIAATDFIAAERRHPDRIGEIYQLAYNPQHRWFYFPRMAREHALVFKCYDSARDGRARFTAHGSFEDPTSAPDAPPRESIEIRSLAFF